MGEDQLLQQEVAAEEDERAIVAPVPADAATDGGDGPDSDVEARVEARVKAQEADLRKALEQELESKWQSIARRDAARYQSEADKERKLREQAEHDRDQVVDKFKDFLTPGDLVELDRLTVNQQQVRLRADEEVRRQSLTLEQERELATQAANEKHVLRLQALSGLGLDPKDAEVQAIFTASWEKPDWAASDLYFTTELGKLIKSRSQPAAPEKKPKEPDPVPNPGVGKGGRVLDFMTSSAADEMTVGLRASQKSNTNRHPVAAAVEAAATRGVV